MKLEEGKYYTTRDGRKVGPMEPFNFYRNLHPWQCGGLLWTADGIGYEGCHPEQDIIAEWKDETLKKKEPTLSVEALDRLALDSLEWHYKDEDMEPLEQEAFRIVMRYYGVPL